MSDIPADDLKIEVWPIPGIHERGGQHVGVCSGVRITHIPSNIQAYVDIGRSQHINKMIAMDMILAAITHPRFR
ncbi:peptide chain release factor-like protein [Rhizobium sp. RHZ02]|uniref:peptide chain release factor family protein n=1 Tax=Rhizobium sp. RHZ02 TaxID=2769306 RepID=UPI00177DB6DC|nr:peptide chain release factor-like protein [Rhizobium sp. RHZ02]MBD9455913.1 peptide chain release factor-like protein [Rhizobium sp. RHZ02]